MVNDFLPEPLPRAPLELFAGWFAEARARAVQPNPDAMVLATVGADCKPAARVVLCKRIDPSGYVVFFTNYESRKAQELTVHSRAAAVLHWDVMQRQVRLEGQVVRSPIQESEDYFASRLVASRIGAWASAQSRPLESRAALARQVAETANRFGVDSSAITADVPRPPHWGGFRLWIDTVELWVEGPGRIHDRAQWRRELTAQDAFTFGASAWRSTRLYP